MAVVYISSSVRSQGSYTLEEEAQIVHYIKPDPPETSRVSELSVCCSKS